MLSIALLALLIAGCGGSSGVAPVDDRAGASKPPSDSHWHTVRNGDTLYSIAFSHGESFQEVARRNGISSPYVIYPGQRLLLASHAKTAVKKTSSKKSSSSRTAKKSTQSKASSATARKKSTSVSSRISWRWPVTGKVVRAYSSSAPRKKGIGISGKLGQNIHAAATGKVVYSGDGLIGYGNLIIIKHDEIYLSAYAHCRKVLVKEGQQVKRGQKIATIGENEKNQPMLHFEIRKNGKPVNPVGYLPKR